MLRFFEILRRNDGAAAIEYAVVIPVLLLLITGSVEYSLIMYASAVLEGSTHAAARLAKTGYVNTSSTGNCASPKKNPQSRSQFITCFVRERVSGLLNPGDLIINAKSYTSFNQLGQSPGTSGLGGPGDVVVYTVSYPWHVYTPMIRKFFRNSDTITLTSSAVVKNEPY